jgi:hypothetical protein
MAGRQPPAIQVRAGHGLADVEPLVKDLADASNAVKVLLELDDERAGIAMLFGERWASSVDQLLRRALVEPPHIELVDDERTPSTQHLSDAPAGFLERLDVMQREHGYGRVEACHRLIDLMERDGAHVGDLRRGIDRDHLVARSRQCRGQLAGAGADLEHARGRSRYRGAHEAHDRGEPGRLVHGRNLRVVTAAQVPDAESELRA